MTDVLSDPIADLEAHFELEIPCGGNLFPKTRPCPHEAAAILVNRHAMGCDPKPTTMKCWACYIEWYSHSTDMWRCTCGGIFPKAGAYEAL
jgi:hypothetical protein